MRFRVVWEFDTYADTPREAAENAWKAMRTPDSIANYFKVSDPSGEVYRVDLSEDEEEGVKGSTWATEPSLFSAVESSEVEQAVKRLAEQFGRKYGSDNFLYFFEHGQWWVRTYPDQALYDEAEVTAAVVDADPGKVLVREGDPSTGLDFEEVS